MGSWELEGKNSPLELNSKQLFIPLLVLGPQTALNELASHQGLFNPPVLTPGSQGQAFSAFK